MPRDAANGASAGAALRGRITAAAARCVTRWGAGRTSIDEIARLAGVSRATVYRLFPGGKQALVEQAARAEIDRFFARFTSRLGAAGDLREWLCVGLSEAASVMAEDAEVRAMVVATIDTGAPEDPFSGLNRLMALVADMAAPFAARFVDERVARRVAEWLARVALSYVSCPSPDYDLRRPEQVEALIDDFVLPSLSAHLLDPAAGSGGGAAAVPGTTAHLLGPVGTTPERP